MDSTSTPLKIFVSFNKADRPWASWIAWKLEEAGHSVTFQDWDFRPGANFPLEMQKATVEADKTVAVLSEDFLKSAFTQPEWAAAFAKDPEGWKRKLVPVRVAECSPDGMFGNIVWVDLVGLSEETALETLLQAFKERGKPDQAPAFPGGGVPKKRVTHEAVPFPGSDDQASPLSRAGGVRWERGSGGEVSLHRVPPPTRHFQGRDQELKDCLTALRSSPLVSVVGLPGIGKTELTHAAAHAALADPELRLERALWFSLAGMRSVDELGNRLAAAFEVSEYKQIEDLTRAIGGQRVLLVLDNAEDLITVSAGVRLDFQDFCGVLLRSCSGLRFLLSTRRALGSVEGAEEIEVPIGRLQFPHDLEVFQAAAHRLTPQEKISTELTQLVQILEGHPLSLTLVAGQVGLGMSLTTLRRRLEEDGGCGDHRTRVPRNIGVGMERGRTSADQAADEQLEPQLHSSGLQAPGGRRGLPLAGLVSCRSSRPARLLTFWRPRRGTGRPSL